MTLAEAALYGAVQGVTEYLPISSSAHLILLPRFLGTPDPGLAFDVYLHLGTLAATLTYFWREWVVILAGVPGLGRPLRGISRAWKLEKGAAVPWQYLVAATIPALAAGAALHSWVEGVLRGPAVLAVALAVGGIALWAADRFARRASGLESLSLRGAVGVGLFQCLALVPGVSRSGSTIIGGRLLGLDRGSAARFSFLLSAPVTGAAVVYELGKLRGLAEGEIGTAALVVAGLSSFAFGILAIGGLLRMLRRFGYLSFAVYRVALALVVWMALV